MIDQAVRYGPALRLLPRGASVLEVGSGCRGAAPHGGRFVAVDLRFDGPPHPGARPVRADARRLPFADEAFDGVLSLDLLEHLAPSDREQAVREMLRVARRRVVVGCPVEEGCGRWDRRLARAYEAAGREAPGWLQEHRAHGLPARGDLLRLLGEPGWRGRAVGNVNGAVHYAILRAGMTRVGGLAAAWIPSAPLGRLADLLSFGETARTILVLDRVDA